MKIRTKMTLLTGIKDSKPSFRTSRSGFTFIEVMVTLVILSLGLVTIFKALFYSLDQINYLTHRLYADNLLEDRLSQVQKISKLYQVIPMDQAEHISVDIGPTQINFTQQTHISAVEDLLGTLKIDLSLSWNERGRNVSLSRSTYMGTSADLQKK